MNTKVKNFIFNDSIEKINETKNNYMEEIQQYKDIQYISKRIKFVFESRKTNREKALTEAKQLAQKLSEKVKSLNVEKLNDIVDQLNKMNEGIVSPINGTEVEEQVNKFIQKLEENEDIIMNFPSTKDESEYDKAVEEAKEKLLNNTPAEILEKLDKNIQGNIEALDLTTNIVRIIVKRYENKPEDVTPEEFAQNISELISKEFEQLKVPEIDKEKLEEIKTKLEEKLSNTSIPELNENIQKAIENLKKELGSFQEMYKNKTLLEINDAIQKEIKDLNLNGLFDKQLNKLKDIQNKMQNVLDKMNLDKLKEAINKLKGINDQSKNQFETFISRIKKLNEKLAGLPRSKVLNRTLVALKKLITRLDFTNTIELLKSLNVSEINPKQEIENIKKIKSLTDEIKEIMDSSPLINIFGQILFQNLNRKLSEKKKRTLQTSNSIDLICKMDDVPNTDTITAEPQGFNSFILNNEVYDLSSSTELKMEFKNDDLSKCAQNKISEVYNNVIYKSHSNIEVDQIKKRIKYKLYARFIRGFIPPQFFYIRILLKLKINHKIPDHNKVKFERILQNGEEVDADSYCVVEDSSDINNVVFNCHSYFDSVADGTYEFVEMNSNYVQIPKNSTTEETTKINGYSYFRTSKSGLSAGAIVGIVLGCVAFLALIAGLIVFLRSRAKATVYPTQSINMSANNAMVPTDKSIPVDLSQNNFNA